MVLSLGYASREKSQCATPDPALLPHTHRDHACTPRVTYTHRGPCTHEDVCTQMSHTCSHMVHVCTHGDHTCMHRGDTLMERPCMHGNTYMPRGHAGTRMHTMVHVIRFTHRCHTHGDACTQTQGECMHILTGVTQSRDSGTGTHRSQAYTGICSRTHRGYAHRSAHGRLQWKQVHCCWPCCANWVAEPQGCRQQHGHKSWSLFYMNL